MNEVAAKIPASWYHFGLCLQIDIGKLEAVEQSHPKDQLQCFSKVYSIWKQENVRPLTWEVVVEILQGEVMAQKVLSSTLANKYNLQWSTNDNKTYTYFVLKLIKKFASFYLFISLQISECP